MQLKQYKIPFLVVVSFLVGCATGTAPGFNWSPVLFLGDSRTQSVQGEFENIKCSDERFNALVCMNRTELEKLPQLVEQIISKCEVWKQ